MTSGARYHLVTTCWVSSLLILPRFFKIPVLLDLRTGLLKIFFLSTTYSVDYRNKTALFSICFVASIAVNSGSSIENPTLRLFCLYLSPLFFRTDFSFCIGLKPNIGGTISVSSAGSALAAAEAESIGLSGTPSFDYSRGAIVPGRALVLDSTPKNVESLSLLNNGRATSGSS